MRNRNTSEPGRDSFTLIELLVVVALIGILMALLFPAVKSAIVRAQRIRATAEVRQIADVMRKFNGDYLHSRPDGGRRCSWPIAYVWTNLGMNGPDFSVYSNVIFEIADVPIDQNMLKDLGWYMVPNPKQLKTLIDTNGNTNTFVADPWGNPYMVRFDMDDNGAIPNPFANPGATQINGVVSGVNNWITNNVLIWSVGPDGLWTNDSLGENSPVNKDNIKSWSQ